MGWDWPGLVTEPISLPEEEPAWRKQILETERDGTSQEEFKSLDSATPGAHSVPRVGSKCLLFGWSGGHFCHLQPNEWLTLKTGPAALQNSSTADTSHLLSCGSVELPRSERPYISLVYLVYWLHPF